MKGKAARKRVVDSEESSGPLESDNDLNEDLQDSALPLSPPIPTPKSASRPLKTTFTLVIDRTGQLDRHIASGRPFSNHEEEKGKEISPQKQLEEPIITWRRSAATPALVEESGHESAQAGPSRHRSRILRTDQDPPSPSRSSSPDVVVSSPSKKRKRRVIKETDSEDVSDAGSEQVVSRRAHTMSSLKKRRERDHAIFGSTSDEGAVDPVPPIPPPPFPSLPAETIDITSSPEPQPIASTSNAFQSMMAKNRSVKTDDSSSDEETKRKREEKEARRKARRKAARGPNGEKNPLSKMTQEVVVEETSDSSQRDTQQTREDSEDEDSMVVSNAKGKDSKGKGKAMVEASESEASEAGRPSEDEDDLSMSGKETLTVERLRREPKSSAVSKFESLRLARQSQSSLCPSLVAYINMAAVV